MDLQKYWSGCKIKDAWLGKVIPNMSANDFHIHFQITSRSFRNPFRKPSRVVLETSKTENKTSYEQTHVRKIHKHVRTYLSMHVCTYTRTPKYAYTHIRKHTCTHTYIQSETNLHIRTHIHIHTHSYTYMLACIPTCVLTYRNIHTHAYTHIPAFRRADTADIPRLE